MIRSVGNAFEGGTSPVSKKPPKDEIVKNPFVEFFSKEDTIAFPLIKYASISISARGLGDYALSEEFYKLFFSFSFFSFLYYYHFFFFF